MTPLAEGDIKACTLESLRYDGRLTASTLVASEVRIPGVARRIDLALFSDEFVGIEIKSELDTLRRLEGQIADYVRHFEKVLLVAAERHVASALKIIPWWIGLYVVTPDGTVERVRKSETPPDATCEVGRLLTNSELRKLLKTAGSREDLLGILDERPGEETKKAVRSVLSARYRRTSKAFWRAARSHPIQPHHLAKLSRFSDRRFHLERLERLEKERWQRWTGAAAEFLGAYNSSSS